MAETFQGLVGIGHFAPDSHRLASNCSCLVGGGWGGGSRGTKVHGFSGLQHLRKHKLLDNSTNRCSTRFCVSVLTNLILIPIPHANLYSHCFFF